MFAKRDKTGREKKRRIELHETTTENDIRYIGPLTTQHFKLFGWLCIVVAQVAVLIRLGGRVDPAFASDSADWLSILTSVADLSLPFLLIANFAQLINAEEGYSKQLIQNAAAMAGICAVFYLLFYRYLVGGAAALLKNPADALPSVQNTLSIVAPYGFFSFNLFVDLFLCTLTMLFLNYKPRHVFTGKFRILFRLMALLPIAYEAGCMLLKIRCAKGLIQLPVWSFPLLTVKPPMTFVLFVALAMFVKTRELRFRRHGKTHEEYQAFLKTRRNSWNFSVFLAIMLVVVSIVDFLLIIGFSVGNVAQTIVKDVEMSVSVEASANGETAPAEPEAARLDLQASLEPEPAAAAKTMPEGAPVAPGAIDAAPKATLTPEEMDAAMQSALDAATEDETIRASLDSSMRLAMAVGFGGSSYLLVLAPLVLLFSYTRKPKYPKLNTLIPVIGIALILLVYLEGFHQVLVALPIEKLDFQEFRDAIQLYLDMVQ